MFKNSKGYLLTETIIAIATVATIITVIYTTSLGNYQAQDIELTKANTAEEVYTVRELRKFLYANENSYISQIEGNNYIQLFARNVQVENPTSESQFIDELSNALDIKYIYVSEYDLTPLLENEYINSQIKNSLIKKEDENDNNCAFRYLIIYNDNSYSTIGIRCEVNQNG